VSQGAAKGGRIEGAAAGGEQIIQPGGAWTNQSEFKGFDYWGPG